MQTQQLLWQLDVRSRLVVDAYGYRATVERLLTGSGSMFTIGWHSDLGPVAISAIRPTTRIAMTDAESALARMPIRSECQSELLIEAALIKA